ncbi:MAG: SDR family oxidoreductase [Chloroflexi bacterium]|nr:SDR family oxidoreductase [Chloroflexota bacterium]
MNSIEGKVVLVTGGARGLGEAVCRDLSAAGAQVILADIRMDLANKVTGEVKAQGGKITALELDLTDAQQVRSAVEKIVSDFGRLDVLVSCAAIDKTVPVDALEVEDWDCIMAVNLRAAFILAKYILPVMRKQGSGYIINVCSTASKRAWPNASVYHASKWGLLGFTHALLTEARPHNIKVTALIPGGMRTPFLLDRFPDIALNALQDPKNVAETVRFLLVQPDETVIPEMMVLPIRETSWP